jgi:hypothetical protein
MNTSKITGFFKSVQTAVSHHSPEILSGIGIAGMITTTVLAVNATPKALRLIENKKDEQEVDKLTAVDTVKTTWKCYIPAAITGLVSVTCLIGASSVNARRNAALATAYKLSETALTEYREKVIETMGEKKEKTVRDAVAKEKLKKNPVEKRDIIITGKGKTLCYDPYSDRYFESDIEKLRKAANDLNMRMFNEMYVSLNEFYSEIELREIAVGFDIGWNINNGDKVELYFSPQLTEDNTPCVCIDFEVPPRYGFR